MTNLALQKLGLTAEKVRSLLPMPLESVLKPDAYLEYRRRVMREAKRKERRRKWKTT